MPTPDEVPSASQIMGAVDEWFKAQHHADGLRSHMDELMARLPKEVMSHALSPVVEVTVPDAAWEPNEGLDDPTNRLRVTLLVNGVYPMHFEAWQVTYDDEESIQRLADGDDEDLDLLHDAVHGDGSFQTLTINGRRYVLVASPYC